MPESKKSGTEQAVFGHYTCLSDFKKALFRFRSYLLLVAGLLFFVVWFPIVSTFSYEYCLHLAVSKGWQFGKEIIGTYGPLGFICLPFYYSPTYIIMIIANIGLYIFMVFYLWRFWRDIIRPDNFPAVWIAALLILPALAQPEEWAPALFMPFILINLLVLWYFLDEKPPSSLRLLPLIVILAAFILVKGTFIFLLALGVVCVALDQMFKWRRVPWLIFIFITAVLFLWVLSGQNVTHLYDFFVNSTEVITGYKDGMGTSGRRDWASAPLFVMASISLAGYFWWTLQKRIGWRSIYPVGVLAATLFVTFQHGFVRADKAHIVPAYLTFFILCILIFPLIWKTAKENGKQRIARALMVIIAVISLCGMFLSGSPKWSVLYQRPYGFGKLVLTGTTSLKEAAMNNLQKIKQENPLPRLKEPVDFSAIDFGLADAYGWQSSFKPTLVSYGTYTPRLSRQNRDYFENASGPATVILRTHGSIDGRYPTVTDSLSFLALKSHFKATANTGKLLILERRTHPLQTQLVKLKAQEIGFSELVAVPKGAPEVFVQIDIQPTLWGKIFNILYKPPPVFIAINTGTQKETFRLTTALAREGMLLSPLLDDLGALQNFYGLAGVKPSVKVSSFGLYCQSGWGWYYHDRIKVTFLKLTTK